MSDYAKIAAECVELALAAGGCVLLWRHVVRPEARRNRAPSPLPAWDIGVADFLQFALAVICGMFLVSTLAGFLVRPLGLVGDARTVLYGGAAQLGMLGGYFVHQTQFGRARAPALALDRAALRTGAATFLMALPLLIATSKLWELALDLAGLPAEKQDLIRMFMHAESRGLLVSMIGLATVVAPLTEELVFRAGLFRYFRTRVPRVAAYLLPALLFASLHVNWNTLEGFASLAPLVVLAVLFSAAYERTGSIGTTIVAHALFNLNTVLLILAGVTG